MTGLELVLAISAGGLFTVGNLYVMHRANESAHESTRAALSLAQTALARKPKKKPAPPAEVQQTVEQELADVMAARALAESAQGALVLAEQDALREAEARYFGESFAPVDPRAGPPDRHSA